MFREIFLLSAKSTKASSRVLLACLLFTVNFFELSPHDGGVNIDSSPTLDANNTLINEHAETINDRATAHFGMFDEMGTRWVGNNLRCYHARLERLDVDVEPVMNVRIEAD